MTVPPRVRKRPASKFTRETRAWRSYVAAAMRLKCFDEAVDSSGRVRAAGRELFEQFATLGTAGLADLQKDIEAAIQSLGITFTVYADDAGIERAWPLDVLPRTIAAADWRKIEAGLMQRLRALNMFIDDAYGAGRILADKVVPAELVLNSPHWRKQCRGAKPRHGAWAHICGSDLIRGSDGSFYVLEDNLRVPSGVAYMLENREIMQSAVPEIFARFDIEPVSGYPHRLYETLATLSPRPGDDPLIVLLTPGMFNSAYFEHVYLATQMGIPLAEAGDIETIGNIAYLRTVDGLKRIDVIYRRIDDWFIDPKAFNPESVLGVPGLFAAWRTGNVALANAPGCGIADSKALYRYVPDIIRYYLAEEPKLGNVPTFLMADRASREDAFGKMREMVFKPADASGGYGIVVGSVASARELAALKRRVLANPRNYIAQPIIELSAAPTIVGSKIVPCRVDLRPFVLQGEEMSVTAGGLTRVALRPGSYIVNSSQGGGSKDTWIVSAKAASAKPRREAA